MYGKPITDSTLVLLVSPNGTASADTKEIVYKDYSGENGPASMIGEGSATVVLAFVVISVGVVVWICIIQKKRNKK